MRGSRTRWGRGLLVATAVMVIGLAALVLVLGRGGGGEAPVASPAEDPDTVALDAADPAPQFLGSADVLGADGGRAGSGTVQVQAPAGVVADGEELSVSVGVPPASPGEVFGAPVRVEHGTELLEDVTIRWSAPDLTDAQRRTAVLVRWDEELAAWAYDPAPVELDGSDLVVRTSEFSIVSWVVNKVTDAAAAVGQTIGEIVGARVDAPSCPGEGDMPEWVRQVVDPDEGTPAAAIRVCFEPDGEDVVTVRVANNRTFTQIMVLDPPEPGWKWTWPGRDAYGLVPALYEASRLVLDSKSTFVIPPGKEISVGIGRPATPGQRVVSGTATVDYRTVLVDVFAYVVDQVPIGGLDNPYFNALAQVMFECAGGRELAEKGGSLEGIVGTVVHTVQRCAAEIMRPNSEFGAMMEDLARVAIQRLPEDQVAKVVKSYRLIGELSQAFRWLTFFEIGFYVSDQLANAHVGPLAWSIRADGRAQELGAWDPSCTDVAADSTALYQNLALQDQFADTSFELHEFPGWASSAAKAVVPLGRCDAEYRDRLADHLPGSWGDRDAAQVVADALRAVSSSDAAGPSPADTATAVRSEGGGPIVVVLDLSSSMNESPEGTPKLEGAKASLSEHLRNLPNGSKVGLITYPGDGDCSAGTMVSPIQSLDAEELSASIQAMQAGGNTPTAAALELAVARIKQAGFSTGTILLVSDGEANCDVDPCETAQSIRDSGFDITIHSTGFRISPEGQAELTCIATATGGTYGPAENSEELRDRLTEVVGPQLTLDVTGNTGTVLGGSRATIQATVTNASPSVAAEDAQLALAFVGGGSDPIFPAVLPPRVRLGNIPPGATIQKSWTVSVGRTGEAATANSLLTLQARHVEPVLASGTWQVSAAYPSVSDAGPLLREAKRVLIVGDSYSSGEGTGEYDEATDNAVFNCHRSHLTYALPAFGITTTDPIVACSGAVTPEYESAKGYEVNKLGTGLNAVVSAIGLGAGIPVLPSPDVSGGMPSQRSQVRDIVADPERSPDVVLMTFGGNDIGFADIITRCAKPGDCTSSRIEIANDAEDSCRRAGANPDTCQTDGEQWTAYKLRSIKAQEEVLTSLYRAVLADINSEGARGARDGRAVPLIVLPYPQVLTSTHGDGCSNMNNNERDFGVQVVRALDATVERAVRALASEGAPIFFAGDVTDSLLPSHTVCADDEDDRWVRPVDYVRLGIGLSGGGANRSEQELMHPTQDGYAAETAALLQWSARIPELSDEQRSWFATAEGEGWILRVVDYVDDGVNLVHAAELDMNQPLDLAPVQVAADGPLVLQASGLQPASSVLVVRNSDPVTLGSFRAGEDGTLRATVRMPADTPRGLHTIDVVGTSPEGEPVILRRAVDVYLPMPWWLGALCAVSVVGAVAGVVILLRLRRTRRT